MSAYAYCRVSVFHLNNISLDFQEFEIRKFAEQNDLKIRCIDKEQISAYGKVSNKITGLADKRNSTMLFYSVDRFSRNVENGKEIAKKILKNSNKMIFIREKLVLDNADNWEVFVEYLKVAEAESANIADRTKKAKSFLNKQGFFTNSKAPFGYIKQKLPNGRSRLVINSREQNVIEFINDCKTPGITLHELNQSFSRCGVNTKKWPIHLNDGDFLCKSLAFANIANLLNDYNVLGKRWTALTISNIYKKQKK